MPTVFIDDEPSGARRLRAEKLEPVELRWGRAFLARAAAERACDEGRSGRDAEEQIALAAGEVLDRYRAYVRRWVLGLRDG
jgi:hypothetical protein